ncbi:MAG: YbgA family protein, partial [Acidobacteria bacterium]|nr:YbgA family protein [Acidobacteriota bacterium]
MAHDLNGYKELGKLVAEGSKEEKKIVERKYFEIFMNSAKKQSTIKKNFNVLQHIYGYLKDKLAKKEKDELFTILEDYKNSLIPLIVPITLLKHHLLI